MSYMYLAYIRDCYCDVELTFRLPDGTLEKTTTKEPELELIYKDEAETQLSLKQFWYLSSATRKLVAARKISK